MVALIHESSHSYSLVTVHQATSPKKIIRKVTMFKGVHQVLLLTVKKVEDCLVVVG